MRKINKIIVHCSAGNPKNTAQDIVNYHMKTLRWSRPGYHYVVEADGKVVNTWTEKRYSNGVKGHNADSVNVCYIGGVEADGRTPKDTRTQAQKDALVRLLKELKGRYPGAKIYGHRDFAAKACPSFDAKKEYEGL